MRYREIIENAEVAKMERVKRHRKWAALHRDESRQDQVACLKRAGIPVEDVDPTLMDPKA